ncbi:MAG: metallophosphoesterase [Deltaproteobacteria bacterium]|nr:metallophosphoesterase [Deltaproteobacteria bacterium]
MLIGGGALLGHLYLYLRLVRQLSPHGAWRRAMEGFLLVMTALLVLRGPIRDLSPDIERVHERVTYSWMALAICLICASVAGDLVRLVAALARRMSSRARGSPASVRAISDVPSDDTTTAAVAAPRDGASSCLVASDDAAPSDPGRRELITRVVPWAVVASGGLGAMYGGYRAYAPPEVSEVALRLAKLPRTLDGLTIVQLTDVHVGPYIGRDFIDRLVASANALRPDVVAITGDLVDGDVPTLGPAVSALGNLRARYGTFFVTGNHEYYSGETEWTRFLERLDIVVLRNRRVEIGDDGGKLDLVGVDDWGGRSRRRQGYDLEAALDGRDPERAAVLLAHQPTNFDVAVARGVDVQLSGHTHGGQMFPMTRLVGLRYAYNRGLYREGDGHIYVSRGCGFWGPPARLDSPPEIVRLTLTT